MEIRVWTEARKRRFGIVANRVHQSRHPDARVKGESEVSMATPVLMSLTSVLLNSGTSEILNGCAKLLAERVKAAHDNYQQTAAQACDTIENERHEAISKINELRNRAAL